MTREEAIKELKEDIELYIPLHGTIDDVDRDLPDGRLITALEMAIKALEQEPKLLQALEQEKGAYNALVANVHCEDAISRSDMLDAIGHGTTYTSEELQEIIKGMPPVKPLSKDYNTIYYTPQPKTGHWINLEKKYKGQKLPFWGRYGCSKCAGYGEGTFKYCPNCGCRMEGEIE